MFELCIQYYCISLWEFYYNYKTKLKILKGIYLGVFMNFVLKFNLGLLQHISTIIN